jgi:5-formyltetrahydrofolate cyclo-ligase
VDALPHEPWDMPLDAVLTERQLYRFNSNHTR